jgi:hypothetical protein
MRGAHGFEPLLVVQIGAVLGILAALILGVLLVWAMISR